MMIEKFIQSMRINAVEDKWVHRKALADASGYGLGKPFPRCKLCSENAERNGVTSSEKENRGKIRKLRSPMCW